MKSQASPRGSSGGPTRGDGGHHLRRRTFLGVTLGLLVPIRLPAAGAVPARYARGYTGGYGS